MATEAEKRVLQEQINAIDRAKSETAAQAIRDRLQEIREALAAIIRGEYAA
jgi:hypothetical protein